MKLFLRDVLDYCHPIVTMASTRRIGKNLEITFEKWVFGVCASNGAGDRN